MGEIYYTFGDLYGTGFSTTEQTIPEADDQTALVDDQKATDTTHAKTANKPKILLSIVLVLIAVVVLGGAR